MEHAHCHKMLNSLIEICIVVGMDQDTGLVPAYSQENRQVSKGNDSDSRLYSTMFEANVLTAMSAETASFPHEPYDQINGEPYYPTYGIVGSPTKSANPIKRRRGSFMLGCRVKTPELPLGQDVINSLPALCFPDGGFVSKKKKPVVCHSLVLTDIEGTRSYCMCMTFYRGFIIKENDIIPGAYKLLYLDEKTDQRALQDSSHTICYVPTCCCLISKWPYFNLMKDCLSCVLPKLLTTDARGFRMALMQFVSQLTMVPVPPAGSLGIEFGLYGVSHVVRPAEDPETRVINMDLRYPFLSFSLDDVLLLMGCILTQQRIVFLSSSYSLLTPVIESFFTFIQPFSWCWTYVSILPSVLLDLVEAPGSFIMGCHAQHKKQVQRVAEAIDELSGIVIADIDEGTVTAHGSDAKIPRLPSFAVNLYKFRMKNAEIDFERLLIQRQTFFSMEELKREQDKFARKFQQLVLAATLEMMLRMFGDIKNFIVQQEDLFFDMDSFIQSKPSEDQDFYRVVCKSHAFSTFLYELMHDPEKTDYFTLKAQKTRVAPKAVPLRKRSSSSSVARISDEFFVNPQEELNIFVLPPFTFEGVYTGRFYEDYLKSLNEKISDLMTKSSSLLANYLYLRGMLRIACEMDVKAVDDFFGVSSRNVQLFPTMTVQEVLCKMKEEKLEELKTRPFWRKTELLITQAKGKKEFRPERKEVVTSAVPSTPLELSDFEKHVSRLQIANSQHAVKRLFDVLKNKRTQVVEPDAFALFYEALREASDKARSVTLHDLTPPLEENEYFLKISQMIKTSRGVGFLVLTVKRLLFLENGTHKCISVIDINDIENVEAITISATMRTRGVTAIQITREGDPSTPFVASVKEEKDFWLNCLLEMKAGYEIADALRDSEIIEHAAQNVIMEDALRAMSDFPEEASVFVLDFRKNGLKNKLSQHTRETLLKRVRPSPQDMEKTTVEALLYLSGSKGSSPKLWCAMGSGVIVVIDANPTLKKGTGLAWEYETHMRHAKERVSCLLAVGNNQVWAGSLDTTIYVINTHTRKADQQLLGHRDSLSHMIETRDKQGYTTVWSASSNGQIIGWDPVTLTAKKELEVKVGRKDEKTLHWFCAVGETFWCATKFSIYVINYAKDHEDTKVLTPNKDELMSIDCMCAVSDTQVWTACHRRGYIVVWNTKTYQNEHYKDLCKCGGFTYMIRVDQKVWAGSKSGVIYVLDAKNVKVEKELPLHEDRVRAMCLTDYGQVISGPGSRDGRLAVWRSDLWQLVPGTEPSTQQKKVHTDEDNGFELVPKQCIVKFNLGQDDTACYFNRTSTY